MENVILSSEQFEKLIEVIRPGKSLEVPIQPNDATRDRSAAVDFLRTCEQYSWGGESDFIKAVRELAKTKI